MVQRRRLRGLRTVDGSIDGSGTGPATNTITFHGSACAAIQAGTVVQIDIVYGCTMPPVGEERGRAPLLAVARPTIFSQARALRFPRGWRKAAPTAPPSGAIAV